MHTKDERQAISILGQGYKRQCVGVVSRFLVSHLRAMGLRNAELDPRSAAELNRLVARIVRTALKGVLADVKAKLPQDVA